MKVVAYSIKPFEKELLVKANQKKHDITFISNRLTPDTAGYAEGKDAVLVFNTDDVSAPVVYSLGQFGVRFIATRGTGTCHIDKDAAADRHIKLANVPDVLIPYNELTEELVTYIAQQTIKNLDLWQAEKCVGDACACARHCRVKPVTVQDNLNTYLP